MFLLPKTSRLQRYKRAIYLDVDDTRLLYRQVRDVKALSLQLSAGIQNTLVFLKYNSLSEQH